MTGHRRTRVIAGLLLAGALLAGALLAGCTSGVTTGPDTSTPSKGANQRLTPEAAALHVSRAAPPGTVSAPWDIRPLPHRATSRRIYLDVVVPVCSGGQMAFTMTATTTKIEIGYWVRPTPKRAVCVAMMVTTSGYIALPAPVGRRTIVHVPAGRHAPD